MTGTEWHERAACREYDPDDWFEIPTGRPHDDPIAEIRAICNTCPVKTQCLQFALDTGQEYGVWGGTTPAERAAARHRAHRRSRLIDEEAVRRAAAGERVLTLTTAEQHEAARRILAAGGGYGTVSERLHLNSQAARGLVACLEAERQREAS